MKEIVVKEDVERKKFEEWCKVRNEGDRLKTDVDDGDVYYVDASIDYAWQGWIARAYESAKAKQALRKLTEQEKAAIKVVVLTAARNSSIPPESLANNLIRALRLIEDA
ncbi:hypothetical protein [Neisseria sicca]|jgi:hypothetical protein|uniref:hypothetical protein n=1 Tax=Neisseria sicca TaxID=490 RepID=UPI002880055E|nr:hypothetical protein [Neisseria sicca]